MSWICGCLGEKNNKKSNLSGHNLLLYFVIERQFYYDNKYGKKIALLRFYDFIWVYVKVITKIEPYKKNKYDLKKKKITDFIYYDIIHYRTFIGGGKNVGC